MATSKLSIIAGILIDIFLPIHIYQPTLYVNGNYSLNPTQWPLLVMVSSVFKLSTGEYIFFTYLIKLYVWKGRGVIYLCLHQKINNKQMTSHMNLILVTSFIWLNVGIRFFLTLRNELKLKALYLAIIY